MSALTDPYAEAVIAGCAIDSPEAAALAHSRLTAADFHDPSLADLFACSLDLPAEQPDHHADPYGPMLHEQRAHAAAQHCDIRPDDIAQILAWRPVMADTAGTYAHRVLAAAQARRTATEMERLRIAFVDGADLDEVRDQLRHLLATEAPVR